MCDCDCELPKRARWSQERREERRLLAREIQEAADRAHSLGGEFLGPLVAGTLDSVSKFVDPDRCNDGCSEMHTEERGCVIYDMRSENW